MNTVQLIGRLTADPDIRAGEKHESATFRGAMWLLCLVGVSVAGGSRRCRSR